MVFVLVHGAWHGSWCWQRLAPLLQARGAQVLAPTLRGLAERVSESSADVSLATHIDEVVELIEAADLRDVTLVGHSYAGLVIAGVADRVPARIAKLVFVDAVIIEPGQRWCDAHPPQEVAERLARAYAAAGGIPPPDAARLGLDSDADVAWVRSRLTPQPLATYTTPLDLQGPFGNGLPKIYIDCRAPAMPGLEAAKQRLRNDPGWQVVALEAGHELMLSQPQRLAEALVSASCAS
ncbi:MAG: alpha/beta fold hydrolase [Burkholderiaceae bacterium]